MIRYEVTLQCSPSTAPELERWMRNTHIPDILATGCFQSIYFDTVEDRFRTVYQTAASHQLDRYLTEHAERMQADFRQRFPTGVAVSRETWCQLQSWTAM
jgi:hypothetical protein